MDAASKVLTIRACRGAAVTEQGATVFHGFALLNGPHPENVIEIFATLKEAQRAASVIVATPVPAYIRV